MQHLVHEGLHGFLSWPDGLSMWGLWRRCQGGDGKKEETHGLESAFFGFRDALSRSDIADCEKGRTTNLSREYEGKLPGIAFFIFIWL